MFINVCPLVIFYAKPFCDIIGTHGYVLISEKGFVTRYVDGYNQAVVFFSCAFSVPMDYCLSIFGRFGAAFGTSRAY